MLDKVLSHNNLTRTEGTTGVRNLALVTRMLGYKDTGYMGQFSPNGSYGDIVEFLEDNPGAISALYEWIEDNMNADWEENLQAYLPGEENEDDESDESDSE